MYVRFAEGTVTLFWLYACVYAFEYVCNICVDTGILGILHVRMYVLTHACIYADSKITCSYVYLHIYEYLIYIFVIYNIHKHISEYLHL